ncbi:MAG: BamA/TamA family outer membrane protein [Thermodesulfobacteriota bacterium]
MGNHRLACLQIGAIRFCLPLLLLLLLTLPASLSARELVRVKVGGVKGELRSNVLAVIDIQRYRFHKELSEEWLKRLHASAEEQIRQALIPFGYYGVEVRGSLTKKRLHWLASYEIRPGVPARVTSLDLAYEGEGKDEAALGAALAAFPLAVGDVLDHKRYEDGKYELLEAARRLGYAKAKAGLAKTLVSAEGRGARMALHIATGPKFYIGAINIEQDIIHPGLMADFVTIKSGDPLNTDDLLAFQQTLQLTDWAEVVAVVPLFDQVPEGGSQVPVQVTLTPSKRQRYQLGVGFETDVGPRFTARWTQRRINRHGHSSDLFLRLAQVRRTVSGSYFIPVVDPRTDRLAISNHYEYEETSDTRRNTLDAELGFIRQNRDNSLVRKLFGQYMVERFEIGAGPTTNSQILALGAVAGFTKVAENAFPQHGWQAGIDLRGGSDSLVSDTSFVRLDLRGKYLFPLGGDNGRVLLGCEVGRSWVSDFDLYPTSLRYFAGGDNSVRGFRYKSLGPVDEDGNVVGGENLLVASLEYNRRLTEKWVGAVFIDGGNAYNDELADLQLGSGLGVRWLFGFGSLKLDLAWPVSNDDLAVGDVRFHLAMGAVL